MAEIECWATVCTKIVPFTVKGKRILDAFKKCKGLLGCYVMPLPHTMAFIFDTRIHAETAVQHMMQKQFVVLPDVEEVYIDEKYLKKALSDAKWLR